MTAREMQGRRDAGETYDSRTPTMTEPRHHARYPQRGWVSANDDEQGGRVVNLTALERRRVRRYQE
jgi:hypothetical protein